MRSFLFERSVLMALPVASRHSDCTDPAHSGHPAKTLRTAVRGGRKTVRIFAGSLSELNRHRVRIESDHCPTKIGSLSEMRRNTHYHINVAISSASPATFAVLNRVISRVAWCDLLASPFGVVENSSCHCCRVLNQFLGIFRTDTTSNQRHRRTQPRHDFIDQ